MVINRARYVALNDPIEQLAVFVWIVHVQSAAEDGDSSSTAGDGAPMGGRVDTDRAAAHNVHSHFCQLARQSFGYGAAIGAGAPRSYHTVAVRRRVAQYASNDEKRRRVRDRR